MTTEPLSNIEIWGLADHEMPEPDPERNILDEQQPIRLADGPVPADEEEICG